MEKDRSKDFLHLESLSRFKKVGIDFEKNVVFFKSEIAEKERVLKMSPSLFPEFLKALQATMPLMYEDLDEEDGECIYFLEPFKPGTKSAVAVTVAYFKGYLRVSRIYLENLKFN